MEGEIKRTGKRKEEKKAEKNILQYNQLSLLQHRHYRLVPGTFRVTNPICIKVSLSRFACTGAKP